MSKLFSLKLYLQGIKKARIVGIAITLTVTVLSAMIPLMELLEPPVYTESYQPPVSILTPAEFAYPLSLLLFLAPILTLTMFSFLNRRNESDFYHAIPFTRLCTYFSFLAATLTWLAIAIASTIIVTSFFWILTPLNTFALTTPLRVFAAYFLAVMLLTALTLLAMTITGNSISNVMIFLLLFCFLRITGALFIAALEAIYPIMITALTPARFLQIDYSLPLALLLSLFDGNTEGIFANTPLWIYTAAISILLIAVGAFFYNKRRSEMAGRSAPTSALQHVYRCAITLPLTFVLAFTILRNGYQVKTVLILSALTLLLYYVYEIVTTKRFKNLLKATLFLPILFLGGLIFGSSVRLAAYAAIHYTPDADELASVRVYNTAKELAETHISYENLIIDDVEITDPRILSIVSRELAEMESTVTSTDADHYLHPGYYVADGMYAEMDGEAPEGLIPDTCLWTLEITEKSGRVCGRTLCLTVEEYKEIEEIFTASEAYQSALLAMPQEDEILDFFLYEADDHDEAMQHYKMLVEEYNALSDEDKMRYKDADYGNTLMLGFEVRGMRGVHAFQSNYPLLPEFLPNTCQAYLKMLQEDEQADFDAMLESVYDPATEAKSILRLCTAEKWHTIEATDEKTASELLQEALTFVETCTAPKLGETGQFIEFKIGLRDGNEFYSQYFLVTDEDFETLANLLDYYKESEPELIG